MTNWTPEARARQSAAIKASWTPERRKRQGELAASYLRVARLPRMMERRYQEARRKGWEMVDWPPAFQQWLLVKAIDAAELKRWRRLKEQP